MLSGAGECSVREIQESFPVKKRPAYTTVQTTVYRLEAKKALRRVKKIATALIFDPDRDLRRAAADVADRDEPACPAAGRRDAPRKARRPSSCEPRAAAPAPALPRRAASSSSCAVRRLAAGAGHEHLEPLAPCARARRRRTARRARGLGELRLAGSARALDRLAEPEHAFSRWSASPVLGDEQPDGVRTRRR